MLNMTLGSEIEIPPHAAHIKTADSIRLTIMKMRVAIAKFPGLRSKYVRKGNRNREVNEMIERGR